MRNLLFLLSLFIISTSQSNAQTDDPNGVIVVNGAHPCSLTGLGRRLSAGRDAEGTDRVSEWPIYPMKRETGLRDPFPEYRQRPNTLWMKEQAGRISSSYDRENKQLDLNLAGTVGFCETAPISETPRMLFQAPKANGLGNWALLGPQVYNYRYGNNFGDQVNEVIPFCNDMDFEETIHLKKGDFFNANGANFQINCSAPNCRAVSFDNE